MALTVQQQMAANSAAWNKASTQAEKDALHAANVALSSGQAYNSAAGTWAAPVSTAPTTVPKGTIGVGANGNAPANQPIGTSVNTAGGVYTIVAPNTPGATFNAASGYWSTKGTPAPPVTPLEAPVAPLEAPVDNTAQIMAGLKEAQLKSTMAGLDKSLNNSLSNLDTQQAGLGQTYYDKRNQAAANSDIGAMNFAQRAASRGIQGNTASIPEIYRNNSLQGELGSLNRDEASANAGISADRTNLNNNYQSDIAGAQAGIEAQSLQNYIDQMNTNDQLAVQIAGLTGNYNGQTTMQGQSQANDNQTQANQNKMAQLEIDNQTIQNSYLPQTLKDQAMLLAQQVKTGTIDYDTALAQLAQIKKQTSNIGM